MRDKAQRLNDLNGILNEKRPGTPSERGHGIATREADTLYNKNLDYDMLKILNETDKIIGKSVRNYKKGIVSKPIDLNKYE